MIWQGQLLPISEYQALFSIVGTTCGGDGTHSFALPKLTAPVAGMNYIICVMGLYPTRN